MMRLLTLLIALTQFVIVGPNLVRFRLTVTAGGVGSGRVTSADGFVNCTITAGVTSGVCTTINYNSSQTATLTATPSGSDTFTSWSGSGCSGTGTCVMAMTTDRAVIATFGAGSGFALTLTLPAAASCSQADVQTLLDAITAAGANQIGGIPSGTCTWTAGITWTSPANTTIIGAGSLSAVGGAGTTVIVDGIASNTRLLQLTSGGNLRIAGLTIQGGSGIAVKDNGLIWLIGGTTRLDHMHFNSTTYTTSAAGATKLFNAYAAAGVFDHSIVDVQNGSSPYFFNGAGTDGNTSWSTATNFGCSSLPCDYWYVEDNLYRCQGGVGALSCHMGDTYTAGRVVYRFNTLQGVGAQEVHATGHSGDDRGARSLEGYGNHYTVEATLPEPPFAMSDNSSGTSLMWGNLADTDAMKNIFIFDVTRADNDTYGQLTTPDRFSFCGTAFWAATVNTTGTAVHGASFAVATGWSGGSGQNSYAVAAGGKIVINGVTYTIASLTDADDLVLTGTAGSQTGVASYILTNWDGAPTTSTGYPCLDQPGRGQGDLLTGQFPSKVNNTTGTIAWPNQALEPIYFWMNTATPAGIYGGSVYADRAPTGAIVAGRDYYKQASSIQSNATTPFNGTTTDSVAGAGNGGSGWGTIANRPTTCTVGVGYFATDQGSWNTSSSNPEGVNFAGADGLFYKCTSTNTWTLYYTPYTYPHPLVVVP